MKIHQIRYVDNVFVYDLVWNVIAILMIIAGLALILSSKRRREAS